MKVSLFFYIENSKKLLPYEEAIIDYAIKKM